MINFGRASQVKSTVSSLGIPKSYQRLGGFPLDDSTVFDTIVNRDAMVEGVRYQGMICYVEETDSLYLLKGGIGNDCWVALNTSDTTEMTTIKYTVKNSPIAKGNLVRLIAAGQIEIADSTSKYDGIIGVALEGGNVEDSISVKSIGEVEIVSDSDLQIGKVCYLGNEGKTVQSVQDLAVILPLGIAVDTKKINLSINNEELIMVE